MFGRRRPQHDNVDAIVRHRRCAAGGRMILAFGIARRSTA